MLKNHQLNRSEIRRSVTGKEALPHCPPAVPPPKAGAWWDTAALAAWLLERPELAPCPQPTRASLQTGSGGHGVGPAGTPIF